MWNPEKSRLPQGPARSSIWLEDDVEEGVRGEVDKQLGQVMSPSVMLVSFVL